MKVHKVSLFSRKKSLSSGNNTTPSLQQNFLYMPAEKKPETQRNITVALVISAAIAVGITIKNISRATRLKKEIVELADPKVGLNKLKGYENNIKDFKRKILYPTAVINNGKEETLNYSRLKIGAIITGEDQNKLTEFSEALFEHAEKLGLKVKHIKGKTRNERAKWIYRNFKKAQKEYMLTGKPIIFDIGDLESIAELRINKPKMAKIEQFLADLNKKDNLGIIWIGKTDKQKSLPLFYNNLPVMISKLTT